MGFWSTLGSHVVQGLFDPLNLFGFGSGSSQASQDTGTGSVVGDIWDKFKNGNSNDINYAIAKQNLDYQKERNKIEDERYAEETAYNRAFAEEERDYSRALQQQIFDREDTALERQAASLSNMGINPLSQNMNGLGAGQAVSAATAPTTSARGGTALHNDYQQQSSGMIEALGSILGLADTINGVQTGQYQRDALALQNDKQFLENLSRANELGIQYTGYFQPGNSYSKGDRLWFSGPGKNGENESLFDQDNYKSASYSAYRKQRKDSMPSWQYTLDSFGQSDVYKQAEKALTNMSNLFDKASSNLWDKSIFELGDKNGKFNPFSFLLNMFGF